MAPAVAKVAFTIALAVVLMGLCALLWIEPGSPEFVADVLAVAMAGVFLGVLIWHLRRASRLPSTRGSNRDADYVGDDRSDQRPNREG